MNNDIQEITQEDYEMSVYVLSILKSNAVILMSWGYTSPTVIKQGLRFSVSGFLLKGTVEVVYNGGSDLFDLTFYNEDRSVRNTLEGIYFDELLSTIDDQVERVDNYKDRVNEEYNFLSNEV